MKSISRIFHCLHQVVKSIIRGIRLINPFAIFTRHWFLTLLFIGLLANIVTFLYEPNKNLSVQVAYWTWYVDWRFWPEWMSKICWLLPYWVGTILLVYLLFPTNNRQFWLRPCFYALGVHLFFLVRIDSIWRGEMKKPLSIYTFLVPETLKNHVWETGLVLVILVVLLIVGLGYYFLRVRSQRGSSQSDITTISGILLVLTLLYNGGTTRIYSQTNKPQTPAPAKAAVSAPAKPNPKPVPPKPAPVYKYKIQSRAELEQLNSEQIKELVAEENRFERRGDKKQLAGPMVHLFDEKEFVYNGGKYKDATIKYRLFSPGKTVPGKKYPLAIFLHGIGEAGTDNAHTLLYLNNLLPLMIGPDKEDFYLLVLQCPNENRGWNFKSTHDGTLDVLNSLVDQLITDLPLAADQLSLFGLSSGGYGTWIYIERYPGKFAAACPAPGNPPVLITNLQQLSDTRIWSFRGKIDSSIAVEPIQKINDYLNACGGYAKLTEVEKTGHGVWTPAMRKYDCFRWMIKQKRGDLFAPLPDRVSFHTWSVVESWRMFLMPMTIAACLLFVAGMPLTRKVRDKFQRRFLPYYNPSSDESETDDEQTSISDTPATAGDADTGNEQNVDAARVASTANIATTKPNVNPEPNTEPIDENIRTWTDASGTRTCRARFIGFAQGKVVLQITNGKRTEILPKYFSEEDVTWLKAKWEKTKQKEAKQEEVKQNESQTKSEEKK